MYNKRIRYITTIFTLDRIEQSKEITIWDNEDISNFLNEEEKHYGLHLISEKEEVLVVAEYTNIIWNYKIYYGSYKNNYPLLTIDDVRWKVIENKIISDLKTIGLEDLKDEIITNLKNKKYFEYKNKFNNQFKNYCV